jgi:hypothetical protein
VYVVDAGNYRIQKFDSKGIFITKWGTSGTADGQFLLLMEYQWILLVMCM